MLERHSFKLNSGSEVSYTRLKLVILSVPEEDQGIRILEMRQMLERSQLQKRLRCRRVAFPGFSSF
jgi:hypothetical protein